MGYSIMIIGQSGSGKSRSLVNLNPETSFLIQSIRKPMPFKGWREKWIESTKENPKGNLLVSDDSQTIIKYMIGISERRPEVKTIVIDDSQYIMANEFMRCALEKGFEKFTRIGQSFWEIIINASKLRSDLHVIFLQHSETSDLGHVKAKTIGKMLDDKITIEGMFTIVLRAEVRDGRHVFLTKNSGNDTVKAPEGMFSSDEIENDLNQVIEAIEAY